MADYRSFMLRVWRSSRPNGRQWSARLEGLQDGQHLRFAELDALLAHLRALLDPAALSGPDPPSEPEHVDTSPEQSASSV